MALIRPTAPTGLALIAALSLCPVLQAARADWPILRPQPARQSLTADTAFAAAFAFLDGYSRLTRVPGSAPRFVPAQVDASFGPGRSFQGKIFLRNPLRPTAEYPDSRYYTLLIAERYLAAGVMRPARTEYDRNLYPIAQGGRLAWGLVRVEAWPVLVEETSSGRGFRVIDYDETAPSWLTLPVDADVGSLSSYTAPTLEENPSPLMPPMGTGVVFIDP